MMDLVAGTVRQTKEGSVREHPEDTDIPEAILIYRGNVPIAVVQPTECDLLDVARRAAYGFSADVLAVLIEVRVGPSSETYRGMVTETDAVSIGLCNRAGDVLLCVMPYSITSAGLVWGEPWQTQAVSGLHQFLGKAMANDPTLALEVASDWTGLPAEVLALSPERLRRAQDDYTAQGLRDEGVDVVLFTDERSRPDVTP